MNILKKITVFAIILAFAVSCQKEVDNLAKLDSVTAPSNVTAVFDIEQDNSGLVTIVPNAEGVTKFLVTFGDSEPDLPTEYSLNETITHIYGEGVYDVGITAVGLTALTTTIVQELNVTFKAPENLEVTIEFDDVNPSKVNVSATADYATIMDIYFGDVENEEPVHAMPDSIVSHIYEEPGDYVITVIAKSGGEATTTYSETITISEASDPVALPIDFESFTVNYAFLDFGGAISTVIDNPDVSGINTSGRVSQFVKSEGAETWAGSLLTLGDPIDFSFDKLFKVKVWSPKAGAIVKLKVENLDNGDISHEVDAVTTTTNEWEELLFDFSEIDINNEYQKVVFFFDFDVVGDGATYYFDDVKLGNSAPPQTQMVENFEGVAPAFTDFGGAVAQVIANPDPSGVNTTANVAEFLKTDGSEVWAGTFFDPGYALDLTTYQKISMKTWSPKVGAVVKLKLENTANPDENYEVDINTSTADSWEELVFDFSEAPAYNLDRVVVFFDFGNPGDETIYYFDEIQLVNEGGGGGSPIEGTWQVAPEAGSLGVGPEQGDISWWSIDDAGVAERGCFFDDDYVFSADGSFSNVLGTDTWLEDWQIGTFECGTPVAPHDGSVAATYTYNEGAGTVTLNGTGAYLGIPKVYNGGELTDPADAPESITYIIEFSENNTVMTVDISIGSGWWRYKMIKN